MSKKLSVCHETAYVDFLALGIDRSLPKLHAKYTAATPNPPSINTLKQWSSRFRWHSRIYHDSLKLSETVRSKAVEQKGESLATLQQELRDAARKFLADMVNELPNRPETVSESRAFYYQMKAVVEMVNFAEALPGGAFYRLIPDEWNERKKFLLGIKLPKHLSDKVKEKFSFV